MLAAAVTLWLGFTGWMVSPLVGAPRAIARTAGTIAVLELVLLLAASYGCDSGRCGVPGEVAGTAARVDVPLLGTIVVLTLLAARRLDRA